MIEIIPVPTVNAALAVPGSKSFTQRALVAAALARGTSVLIDPLVSEDTDCLAAALVQLGAGIIRENGRWQITGTGGRVRTGEAPIYLGNNGTAARFLTSIAALGHRPCRIEGDTRLEQRPIGPLLEALRGWGVDVFSLYDNGCPPLQIDTKKGGGIAGGTTLLPQSRSSQYLSSLLLAAPYAVKPATLEVAGIVPSRPYVAMTMAVMNDFGITVDCTENYSRFAIPQGCYTARQYQIEGDASSASYFWAAAAICGGRVEVENVSVPSLQGDAMLAPLLGRMGCTIERTSAGLAVTGCGQLQGIDIDMADMPDVVPTLAVVAAFAEGSTTIRNIGHLRIKECDRLSVVAANLERLGVEVDEFDDALVIHGIGGDCSRLHGAVLETHNDHRMAMSFAVAGLRVSGVKILGEECVAKSFPDYWQHFAGLMGVPLSSKK